MRRTSFAIGLPLSLAAVAIVTFVFGVPSKDPQNSTEPRVSATVRLPPSVSTNAEPGSAAQRDDYNPAATNAARVNTSYVDEETDHEMLRQEATEEIRKLYPLLVDNLNLSDTEIDALFEFLINDLIANTRTRYSSGHGLSKDERDARIAAIIGDSKRQQLTERERNRREYAEVISVQSMLEQKAVPLSDSQRDDLLEILVDVRDQEKTLPGSDAEPGTMAALEYAVSLVDEYERLVLELAPSVLSTAQVEFLFNRYQAQSYRRARSVDIQKQLRADTGKEDAPLFYPAGN